MSDDKEMKNKATWKETGRGAWGRYAGRVSRSLSEQVTLSKDLEGGSRHAALWMRGISDKGAASAKALESWRGHSLGRPKGQQGHQGSLGKGN